MDLNVCKNSCAQRHIYENMEYPHLLVMNHTTNEKSREKDAEYNF
jgi:hypothetical protein